MICPNCKTEMIKGTLYQNGSMWQQSEVKALDFKSITTFAQVIAWKCETCQKIELSTTSPTRG